MPGFPPPPRGGEVSRSDGGGKPGFSLTRMPHGGEVSRSDGGGKMDFANDSLTPTEACSLLDTWKKVGYNTANRRYE